MGDPAGQRAQAFHSLGAQKLLLQLFALGDVGTDRKDRLGASRSIKHQRQMGFNGYGTSGFGEMLKLAHPLAFSQKLGLGCQESSHFAALECPGLAVLKPSPAAGGGRCIPKLTRVPATTSYVRVMKVLTCFIVLCLGLASFAQDSLSARGGQFLTVRVQGASGDITTALLDLNSGLQGLELRSEGKGVWTGAFVLLPNMVAGMVRPEVRLFNKARILQPSGTGSGVSVELASSELDQEGLATVLEDRSVTFVFGASIDTASINFITASGQAAPQLSPNTFSLPGRIVPENVSAIVAQTTEGVDLIFSPDWGTDTAGSRGQ